MSFLRVAMPRRASRCRLAAAISVCFCGRSGEAGQPSALPGLGFASDLAFGFGAKAAWGIALPASRQRRFSLVDRALSSALTQGVTSPSSYQAPLSMSGIRRPDTSHVIFDFDGTLSWLRHGWPHIMLEVFLVHAPKNWVGDVKIRAQILSDIMSLNGKPSVHQAGLFCHRVREAGFVTAPAGEILGQYHRSLRTTVRQRIAFMQTANCSSDAFVICGARRALEILFDRGLTLMILSGTIEDDVREEAKLLGLSAFFGRHIYGSPPRGNFSKKDVIERIMREEGIDGRHLLAFGDGPVETQFTKAAGGLAIGVASDENENGSHKIDPLKREQLLRAGADAIIADYDHAEALLATVFSK